MKNILSKLSLLLFFLSFNIFSQDIILTFDSEMRVSGNLVTLDRVTIENLTKNTSIELLTTNTVNLTTALGLEDLKINLNKGIKKVYPNPFETELNIEFYSEGVGISTLKVYDVTGKIIKSISTNFEFGEHQYTFTPQEKGIYFIVLNDNNKTYTSRVISTHSNSESTLTYKNHFTNKNSENKNINDVFFEIGDVLLFTGYSGNYINTIYNSPTESRNFTFRMTDGYYRFEKYHIESNFPNFVDVMFSVTDEFHEGVDYLTNDDFIVLEDGNSVSPSETFRYVKKLDQVPYSQKLVIMLDNSASVSGELADIKSAAITLINQLLTNPLFSNVEIALYSFSDNPTLLQDFTNDITSLETAINDITLGFPSTNLYGSLITGLSRWDNTYTLDAIQEGYLIALTDGDDTQGSSTLSQVLTARGNKKVFMVGLGSELNPAPLNQISHPGDHIEVSNISDLEATFIEIQASIYKFSNSFYWLNYMSPKRNGVHNLRVEEDGNLNTNEVDNHVDGQFSAVGFQSVYSGVYANISPTALYGVDEINWHYEGTALESQELKATSYWATAPPIYTWSIADENIATITVDSVDSSKAVISSSATSRGTTTLTLTDIVNGFTKEINIIITDQLPIITTIGVTNISGHYAIVEAEIVFEGDGSVSFAGICWNTSPSPIYSDNYTTTSSLGLGTFSENIGVLNSETTYYIRAFAYNSYGVSYSNEISITTTTGTPHVNINSQVDNIMATSATLNGTLIENGGLPVTAQGFCWSESNYPTLTDAHSVETETLGSFSSNISNLTPDTAYYVRAYATNSLGTTYSNNINYLTFTTQTGIPIITFTASNITNNSIIINGHIEANGAVITEKGVYWSTSNYATEGPHINEGSGSDDFTSNLTGLTQNIMYNLRAYVKTAESAYSFFSPQWSFTTKGVPILSDVSTSNPTVNSISASAATDRTSTNVGFVWSTNQNPTLNDNVYETQPPNYYTFNFSTTITGLNPNTLYYVRAYATNQYGTGYGNQVGFVTLNNIYSNSITLTTQQDVDDFSTNYPGITGLLGNLFIGSINQYITSNITDLTPLDVITTIGTNLSIVRTSTSVINGFNNLTSVGNYIYIRGNNSLHTLNGFNNLISLGDDLKIDENAISTFNGFNSLTIINGSLEITENTLLQSFSALSNLITINNIDNDYYGLGLINNGSGNISLLENITTINGRLVLYGLSNLNITTSNLSSIESLQIMNCDFNTLDFGLFDNLTALGDTNSSIYIRSNTYLSTLDDFCILQPLLSNYTGTFEVWKTSGYTNTPITQQEIIDYNCD